MIKYVKGCLLKYNKPLSDGFYVIPEAIDKTKVKTLPITPSFCDHSFIIGHCHLEYREDGVYYTFYPSKTVEAKEVLDKWNSDYYIGFFCNNVEYAKDDPKKVIHANLVYGGLDVGHSPVAYVEQAVFDVGGDLD